MVLMMGNPAPTFVSNRNFTSFFRAIFFSLEYESYFDDAAILLAATTLTLCESISKYSPAISLLEVQSTNTELKMFIPITPLRILSVVASISDSLRRSR